MSRWAEETLTRLARYRTDPWAFLQDCVYTLDQTDAETPIKKFPTDLVYIYVYVRCWQRYRKILVPKSRRMIMSWTNVALYLWDAMFHQGRFNAVVSRKEDAADELIQRMKFIYEHIPESAIPRELLPRMHYKFNCIQFEEINSMVQGFPQGADQLRQFTFSGIMGDEMAFWENAQAMYAASAPTLEGGGRFTGISSPGPGFFKRMVFDKLDIKDSNNVGQEAEQLNGLPPIEGVEIRINTKNRFLVFQLHYSANPKKRDDEYRNSISSSMPYAQYMQEYELQWDSFVGMPVYQDFKKSLHVARGLVAWPGLPLLRGWDFGLTPACVVAQVQGDRLIVLASFHEKNMGAERFVPQVLAQCAVMFPTWNDNKKHWRDYGDPAGSQRKDTDEGTCFLVMVDNGIIPRPGAVAWERRKGSVEHFLLKTSRDGPGFQISEEHCEHLIRGMAGGYRYPEKTEEVEPENLRPLKDEYSHDNDGLQMITSSIVKIVGGEKNKSKSIPSPSYSWTGPQAKVEITI